MSSLSLPFSYTISCSCLIYSMIMLINLVHLCSTCFSNEYVVDCIAVVKN